MRFIGIEGSRGESWQESEKKVRLFIRVNLCLPEYEHVEIERAHRIGGGNSSTSTIMVKFTKYKDKETILHKAKQTFIRNAKYYVQEEYTDRVKLHRRELGKRLAEARQNGQYAVMRYDK